MTYRAYREVWHRCGVCRTRRATAALLMQHKRDHPECKPCNCNGYPLKHRPGSSECMQHPRWPVFDAIRRGADDDEVEFLRMMHGVPAKPGTEPPF